jgi:hypothetical protein
MPTKLESGAGRMGTAAGKRYYRDMTGLLQEALRRVESLSREEQDAIAAQILETLEDEEKWTRKFRENPGALRSLAHEALEEHRRGETRPIDELIG